MARVRLFPLLAAVAVAATLAGCGGSEDEPATSSASTTSTTTAAEATPMRLRLEKELRRLLESGDGRKSVDVDCAIKELRKTLPNDLLQAATEAAARGEEIPKEAVDAAYAAGSRCATG